MKKDAIAFLVLTLANLFILVVPSFGYAAVVLTCGVFAIVYFILMPATGVYLCFNYVLQGDKFYISAGKTTAIFFVALLISQLVGSGVSFLIKGGFARPMDEAIGVMVNNVVLFTIYAAVGSLVVSFVISYFIGARKRLTAQISQ